MTKWEAPKPEAGQTYDDWLRSVADSLEDWVNLNLNSEDD